MMFPFMSLPDGTDIEYSEPMVRNGKDIVLIRLERWNNMSENFDSMECEIPSGRMFNIVGYGQDEADKHRRKLQGIQDIILECSRESLNLVSKNKKNAKTKHMIQNVR